MKKKKEIARFVGFRLYERHRVKLRRAARNNRMSESKIIRTLIEAYGA